MTCCIDHDAENAIPLFLCVACNRESITTNESREALAAAVLSSAVERVQLEAATHAR